MPGKQNSYSKLQDDIILLKHYSVSFRVLRSLARNSLLPYLCTCMQSDGDCACLRRFAQNGQVRCVYVVAYLHLHPHTMDFTCCTRSVLLTVHACVGYLIPVKISHKTLKFYSADHKLVLTIKDHIIHIIQDRITANICLPGY